MIRIKCDLLKVLCFTILISSCKAPINPPKDIKTILNSIGDDKNELETVIRYYNKKPEDSLKLKATYFLIRNIVGLKTLDTTSVENNDFFFNYLDQQWKKHHVKFDVPIISKIVDSLNLGSSSSPRYSSDVKIVTSDFLINNIDKAYSIWRNAPWSKHISFTTFCEYILPYRCSDTFSEQARNFFILKYNRLLDSAKTQNSFDVANIIIKDIDTWFSENNAIFLRYPFLGPVKFNNLLKAKIGDCYAANSVRVTALRSLGIPAAIDKVPLWGDLHTAHFWYKIIDPSNDTIRTLINNLNYPKETQYLIPGSSYDVLPPHSGLPPNIKRQYIRTIPKVYRECYTRQTNSLQAIKSKDDEIPLYFSNDRLKDVTNEYVTCHDVTINLKSDKNQKIAYLCLSANNRWIPCAWAVIKNGIAIFKDMGPNIVYLPAYYIGNQIIPADAPFILHSKGELEKIVPHAEKEVVRLNTKFPFRTLVESWMSTMIGGRFQFANKADLSDTITIHTIKQLPFYQTTVKVNTREKYRYLIFQFKGLLTKLGVPNMEFSSLEFWGKDTQGHNIKLKGKLIGNPGDYPYLASNLTDEDRLTYFKNQVQGDTYVGIDLGLNNATEINEIKYIPRNDDNIVIPGVKYQLSYWDNKWISLGVNVGDTNNHIAFQNVPKEALLLLQSTEGGMENRIFIYKNAIQSFW